MEIGAIKNQVNRLLQDLLKAFPLDSRHILVLGVSTSEVLGQKIGSFGSEEVAKEIYEALQEAKKQYRFHLAFQGCEHINRALTVEKETAERFGLDIVTVIPVKKAGGSMAAYAYRHLQDPVVVEFIKADAGIDIGDTFIGMHLKHVAVPLRPSIHKIGEAHVTMAKTRPKLIGGVRAQYALEDTDQEFFIKEIKDNTESSC